VANTLVADCPRCLTKRVGFSLVGNQPVPKMNYVWEIVGVCGQCDLQTIFRLVPGSTNRTPPHPLSDANSLSYYVVAFTVPTYPEAAIPAHLPDDIADAMLEAHESISASALRGAAMLYRAAMEAALRDQFPSETGMLNARIRKAAESGHYPQAMVDWLDQVRVFANEVAHELPKVTREDVEAAKEFATLFLTYVYTMPERVREAKAKAAS
jgi:hypothetical protein